ncbi:rhodanese-like domain-containing protein [Henriciella litoralis]|uniref:rhodanese-like domain-containing protein n=1 Tax=Henriciella litoralis TaxID=568102 RepID=UPI000A06215E|nr:rhodanese-like domain-containing protein [Henriciella litoralis]
MPIKQFPRRSAIVIGAVSVALALAACSASTSNDEITVEKTSAFLEQTDSYLIDVRTPDEWKQTGVASDAVMISLQNPDFVGEVDRLTGEDHSAPIALICRSGARSARARDQLKDAGYKNVVSVRSGMLGENGWIEADLPVRPVQ